MKMPYSVLLIIVAAFLVLVAVGAQARSAAEKIGQSSTGNTSGDRILPPSGNKKILVAYFSRTGNTREIAKQIHKRVGGDIFEIQVKNPYPIDYEAVTKRARQEQESDYKPELKTKIENIGSYDVIFIGSPIWWSRLPPPVVTFLSQYDFSGKTIVPFCTHGGSGQGQTIAEISKLCPKSTVLDGIAVWGKDAKNAQNEVYEWLRRIKITKILINY